MLENVKKRLESLGYSFKEEDAWVLEFCIKKVEDNIKSRCNTTVVPKQLVNKVVDCVCGEFLYSKKQTGNLDIEIETAVKQIKTGDTTITYDEKASDNKKLDALFFALMHISEEEIVCYRKLLW